MQVKINGQIVDYDGAVALMDEELREAVHFKLGLLWVPSDPIKAQVFADEYAAAHERVYGTPFVVN